MSCTETSHPLAAEVGRIARELGFSGEVIEVPKSRQDRWYLDSETHLFHAGWKSGIELLASDSHDNTAKALSRWMSRLARRTPLRRFVHLRFHDGLPSRLGIVRPGQNGTESLCIRELTPTLIEEFGGLENLGREHLTHRIADLLSRKAITDRFFRRFRHVLLELESQWQNLSQDDRDQHTRRDLTMALLCRLMFVSFVSHERGLNRQRNYLRWLLEQPRNSDIYRSHLKPLFFGVLNTPVDSRNPQTQVLGDLPFLNGGLFQPLAPEVRNPELTLPDRVLANAIHRLFEQFEFSSRHDLGEQRSRVIDPEMLGQVFEALMHADERRQSGTYYTPSSMVLHLSHQILIQVGEAFDPDVGRWVAQTLAETTTFELTNDQALGFTTALDDLKILDPAVGSGAFLLGLMDVMVHLHLALQEITGRTESRHEIRRRIIIRNLYGVDLKPGAVRLCELRMWLSLIGCLDPAQPIEPLPNLDHHIRQGDSLSEPQVKTNLFSQPVGDDLGYRVEEFADLHGPDKDRAVVRRRREERARLLEVIQTARSESLAKIQELSSLSRCTDLFGHPCQTTSAQVNEVKRLQQEILALDDQKRELDRGGLPFFSFRAAFPEVFERGGFDIVLGNPPWIRIHDIPDYKRRIFKHRFSFCRGSSSGFDQQVDLSVLFVERALELAKPEGWVALLLPAKLFRAKYGRVLRRQLVERYSIRHFGDFSLQHPRLFKASNYPSWLIACKRPARTGETALVASATPSGNVVSHRLFSSRLSADPSNFGPWMTIPPPARDALETMRSSGVNLSSYGLRARLGLKTGCNSVFFARRWECQHPHRIRLVMPDHQSLVVDESWAPLVLRGRDVSPFGGSARTRILLPYDWRSGRPLTRIDRSVATYFEKNRELLLKRRDYSGSGPDWTVFRTAALRKGPKIVWRDISRRLEATFCPSDPHLIPLNTTYFFIPAHPNEGRLLTALLNSLWMRLFAVAFAEPAMSGYFRFLAWTVEQLPWPERLQPKDREAERLVSLCQQAEGGFDSNLAAELDDVTAFLFGLNRCQQAELRRLNRFFPNVFDGEHDEY